MDAIQNETVATMLADLHLQATHTSPSLRALAATDSRALRDLKLNVSSVLGSSNMSRKESSLLALSVAINEKNESLIAAFDSTARKEGATDPEISETHACVAVMSANNVFYRFRHYMEGNEFYEKTPAGLRMSVMMNPVMGKELFELMSLVVSAVNGCERCVTSHEASVKNHGASEPRIYDAMRLAAVIRSLCIMI